MPLDGTPTPDLSDPTARGLSYLLRHPEEWPDSFKGWDFRGCNTCAMGLAEAQWPFAGIWGFPEGRLLSRAGIFAIDHYDVPCHAVRPDMIADAIDRHLARVP
jgi:hypothetical protein